MASTSIREERPFDPLAGLRAFTSILGGLVFIWLVGAKVLSRLAARRGCSMPCPTALAWALDTPFRRPFKRVTLDRVGIRPGERVLELGPGPGAFTVDAARRVGPEGRLIAVDIQPEMIARVETRVRAAGLDNVKTHVRSAYDLPLADGSVDRAFLIAVLPEIPDQARALAELRRVLKPGGVLSVSEQFVDPDYRFLFETLRAVEAAGFFLEQRYGNFWAYTINFWVPGV
jgi:ubiquinone/menaquinone biosynthesis C-methylase UbiE